MASSNLTERSCALTAPLLSRLSNGVPFTTRRIPISSVILSSQRVDLKDALYTAGKGKAQDLNPLVLDGQKA
jgi:hypothetical protein